jgi:hypothetical protein
MSFAHMIFLAVIVVTVAGVVLVAMLATSSVPLRERLQAFRSGEASAGESDGRWIERVARVAQPFSTAVLAGGGLGTLAAAHPLHERGLAQPIGASAVLRGQDDCSPCAAGGDAPLCWQAAARPMCKRCTCCCSAAPPASATTCRTVC